jgi:hypothetical protein
MVVLMAMLPPQTHMQNGVIYGYIVMIVALSTVFLGIKQYRDKALGGTIRFGTAVLVGLGISAIASVIYAIAWELSLALSGFDFAGTYSRMTIDAAQARGASAEEIRKLTQDAESFVRMYANPLYRLPITFVEMFPVGVLISLISAAVLRNNRVLPARGS